jgi:hypothetical protein
MSAIVQRASGILSVGNTGIPFTAPVTEGNLLIAVVLSNGNAVTGVSDAADNLWAVAAENIGVVDDGFPIYIWFSVAKTTASLTPIPAIATPSQTDMLVQLYEIAGYDSLDQKGSSAATQTANPIAVATAGSTKVVQEFVLAAFSDVGGDAPTDGWTGQTGNEGSQMTLEPFTALFSEGFEVVSMGVQTATATNPDNWADGCVIATFYSSLPKPGSFQEFQRVVTNQQPRYVQPRPPFMDRPLYRPGPVRKGR